MCTVMGLLLLPFPLLEVVWLLPQAARIRLNNITNKRVRGTRFRVLFIRGCSFDVNDKTNERISALTFLQLCVT